MVINKRKCREETWHNVDVLMFQTQVVKKAVKELTPLKKIGQGESLKKLLIWEKWFGINDMEAQNVFERLRKAQRLADSYQYLHQLVTFRLSNFTN
jgi:hypothetical protein